MEYATIAPLMTVFPPLSYEAKNACSEPGLVYLRDKVIQALNELWVAWESSRGLEDYEVVQFGIYFYTKQNLPYGGGLDNQLIEFTYGQGSVTAAYEVICNIASKCGLTRIKDDSGMSLNVNITLFGEE